MNQSKSNTNVFLLKACQIANSKLLLGQGVVYQKNREQIMCRWWNQVDNSYNAKMTNLSDQHPTTTLFLIYPSQPLIYLFSKIWRNSKWRQSNRSYEAKYGWHHMFHPNLNEFHPILWFRKFWRFHPWKIILISIFKFANLGLPQLTLVRLNNCIRCGRYPTGEISIQFKFMYRQFLNTIRFGLIKHLPMTS